MFGWNEEEEFYELCRIMIDFHFQNKGYGTRAIRMILDEMKSRFGCTEVYLSTDPENTVGSTYMKKSDSDRKTEWSMTRNCTRSYWIKQLAVLLTSA